MTDSVRTVAVKFFFRKKKSQPPTRVALYFAKYNILSHICMHNVTPDIHDGAVTDVMLQK